MRFLPFFLGRFLSLSPSFSPFLPFPLSPFLCIPAPRVTASLYRSAG